MIWLHICWFTVQMKFLCSFFFKYFLYLFKREPDSERGEHKQGEWERKKQAPSGGPDWGLDPRMLGSRPEPKADT